MAKVIDVGCERESQLELSEFIECVEGGNFDTCDPESLSEAAPLLRSLGSNRDFLARFIETHLKSRDCYQERSNVYGAQVLMLHRGANYIVRANFWPSANDPLVRLSGTAPFFYFVPHDHNFNFLTIGYFGPGYWSDYYEYDYAGVVGVPGEEVDLRFVRRDRLKEGRILLYRAHHDVHNQLPADSLSVSLNLMEVSERSVFTDQYRFDLNDSTISGHLARSSLESLLALVGALGGPNGKDLLIEFSKSHPSERVRVESIRALLNVADDCERDEILQDALRSRSAFVSGFCNSLFVREF